MSEALMAAYARILLQTEPARAAWSESPWTIPGAWCARSSRDRIRTKSCCCMTDSPLSTGEDLRTVYVHVGEIVPNGYNPNRMNDRTYQAERESIRLYGFIDPITVRPHPTQNNKWEIIDGEHRWRAAQDEGIAEVPILSVGAIPDAAAKKLTVIMNETRGEADRAELGKLMADLSEDMGAENLLEALPFDEKQVSDLVALGAEQWKRLGGNEQEKPPPPDDEQKQTLTLEYTDQDFKRLGTFMKMMQHELQVDDASQLVLAVFEAAAKERNEGP